MSNFNNQIEDALGEKRGEKEILERFQRGDARSFDELYAAFGPRLYRFGLRLSGRSPTPKT